MASARTPWRPQTDVLALEANVASAGMALACPYSTSDEYEAEFIKERRAAGAYDAGRAQRIIAMAIIVAMAVALFVYFVP